MALSGESNQSRADGKACMFIHIILAAQTFHTGKNLRGDLGPNCAV